MPCGGGGGGRPGAEPLLLQERAEVQQLERSPGATRAPHVECAKCVLEPACRADRWSPGVGRIGGVGLVRLLELDRKKSSEDLTHEEIQDADIC